LIQLHRLQRRQVREGRALYDTGRKYIGYLDKLLKTHAACNVYGHQPCPHELIEGDVTHEARAYFDAHPELTVALAIIDMGPLRADQGRAAGDQASTAARKSCAARRIHAGRYARGGDRMARSDGNERIPDGKACVVPEQMRCGDPMTPEEFDRKIAIDGWALLEGIVPERMVERMRVDLADAYDCCRSYQIKAGMERETVGTLHHIPALGSNESFLEFLTENPAAPYISAYFNGQPYVLNSCGGNFNFPESDNYASAIHRDQRSYFRDRMMLNTIVALDELTKENGATWIIAGGHRMETRPGEGEWNAKSKQITAPAGSIILFDSRLWHRAGQNKTSRPRRIITPIYGLPFIKSGFDYCRALGARVRDEMPDTLKQILGYYARTPDKFEEWYSKDRFYRKEQG
jgi:hypothetical protein